MVTTQAQGRYVKGQSFIWDQQYSQIKNNRVNEVKRSERDTHPHIA